MRIALAEAIGADLMLRVSVPEVLCAVADGDVVELDFNGVRFASRSFCDELLGQIEQRRLRVTIVHPDDEVRKMLEVVKRQRQRKLDPNAATPPPNLGPVTEL